MMVPPESIILRKAFFDSATYSNRFGFIPPARERRIHNYDLKLGMQREQV